VALTMSVVLGFILGITWTATLRVQGSIAIRAMLGAIIATGSMLLALDSLRNTVIASHELFWGLIPLTVLLIAGRVADWFETKGKPCLRKVSTSVKEV